MFACNLVLAVKFNLVPPFQLPDDGWKVRVIKLDKSVLPSHGRFSIYFSNLDLPFDHGLLARSDLFVLISGMNPDLSLKQGDRKSTRLNSSHVRISYAVFCL